MGMLGRLLGTESCNGMFHYPLFMSRKKKADILDAMILAIDKSMRKKKCDGCGIIFTEKMSRWSRDNLNDSCCILCHKKYYDKKSKDYYFWKERNEIRKLKELNKQNRRNTK